MRDHVVVQPVQPHFVRAEPQRTPAILDRAPDADISRSTWDDILERSESDPVEPHQTYLRAQPEIPVARLQNRINRRLRQPLLHLPDAMNILGKRAGRVEPVRDPDR